ncbi:MAG: SCP2 sterol-binding domain-containing protein [Actinomycetota bacterium]
MASFLSPDWFETVSRGLALAPLEVELFLERDAVRVVVELTNGPVSLPHAMTFSFLATGPTVTAGDHLLADVIIRLSYNDGLALSSGELDSGTALREGRLKVRGDVTLLVPFATWLRSAREHLQPTVEG